MTTTDRANREEQREAIVRRIHETPTRCVFVCSGGGSEALAQLLTVPGASRTVLEASIPYCPTALSEFLGGAPDRFCSADTARAMAMAAFLRGMQLAAGEQEAGGALADDDLPVAGIACTAGLATDRPRRGEHRVHIAAQTRHLTCGWSVVLSKGSRSRTEEESVAAAMLLNALAEICGLPDSLEIAWFEGELPERAVVEAPRAWADVLLGKNDAVRLGVPRDWEERNVSAIFPGAFNPLHAGHLKMAEVAERMLGAPVEFEISVLNVDKPPLDFLEIRRRTEQFSVEQNVWLTRAATFEEKSARFPGATFIVGVDTLLRITNPRYYGNNTSARDGALQRIAERGCRFLVFGRAVDGHFQTLDDVPLPEPLRAICRGVPGEVFREDVSSTELRQGATHSPEDIREL